MKHIAWSYLYSEEIYITVPLHHRLADWEQATLKDIENEPFITMKPSYSLRILTNRVCALANVHPKIIFEGDDTNTIASLVASNLAFLSSRRFQEAMRSAFARSTFPSRHAREKSASHGT